MLYSNSKSHRSYHQGSNGTSYSAKPGKGANSQSLSNVSSAKQYLNVPKYAGQGGVNSVSGESVKTSPSTDNSRDNSQPREFESANVNESDKNSFDIARTRASSDNMIMGPYNSSASPEKGSSSAHRGSQLQATRKGDQRYKQQTKQSNLSTNQVNSRQQTKTNSPEGERKKKNVDQMLPSKLTTPYPHKYKTVMCKMWMAGESCKFGDSCNYAHGKQQLKKPASPSESNQITQVAQATTQKTRSIKKSQTMHVTQSPIEAKSEEKSKFGKLRPLDFSKIYEPEGMKFNQDSSGEEAKNDSRGILQEILVKSDCKNDSALEEDESFGKEIQPEQVSCEKPKCVSQNQTPSKKILSRLYSTNLDDLISLSVRKAYSEMLPPDSLIEASPEHQNIHKVIEEQIEESPELKMVQRLSIFEEICPSDGPQSEQKYKSTVYHTQFGTSDGEELKRCELDFFKERSGLSIEFEKKSADAEKLDGLKVGLGEQELDQFNEQSPHIQLNYQVPSQIMDDSDEPLRKSQSVNSELAMQIKTEQACSKNSRKYQNRRFRPKMAEHVDQIGNGLEIQDSNKL